MRTLCRSLAFVAGWVCLATSVGAQPPPHEWSRGTTLHGFAGVATEPANTGAALGGALGWEVTPRIGIEGSASWMDFGADYNAFGAGLKMRVRLFGRHTVDPFLQGGIGLYRAAFDAEHDSGDGQPISAFYRRRMDAEGDAAFGHVFTDPSFIFGGGVNLFVSRHFAVRPDIEAMVIVDGGHSQMVTTAAIHAVYHFEDHPVTPRRRR
jgi:hypothetical protein